MPGSQKPNKQAVIVVHGMGEQRPMETLRAFVTAVWKTDADGRIPEQMDEARRTWVVPDRRNGILDLSRITTRANHEGVRTDFFELYWADVFAGNTLQQLSGWLKGLLLRWPVQVPRDVFWAWVLLWVLTVLAAAALSYVMINNPLKIFEDVNWGVNESPAVWHWLVSALFAVSLMLFMQARLAKALSRNADAPFQRRSRLIPPAVLLVVFLGLVFFFPWEMFKNVQVFLLTGAALIAWLIKSVVVPYLGDVARYTLNEPWAIEARARIRARGLGLLRELHGRTADGSASNGGGGYQRVIVVGHSLGSVVAYDLLRFYWAEAGPVGKNPASKDVIAALAEVDGYLTECFGPLPDGKERKSFGFGELLNRQSAAANAMSESHDGWKITDFVTLGCPLTHAEFLIANDAPQFRKMVDELVLPISIPVQDTSRGSFLYDPHYGKNGGNPAHKRADHGAVFAGTRWTNIYDPERNIVFGDFISGPLTENFGRGVRDVAVFIREKRRLLGWFASDFFTHTQYWNAKAIGQAALADVPPQYPPAPDDSRMDHILALKDALRLGSAAPIEPKSRSAPAQVRLAPAGKPGPKSRRADTTSRPS